MKILTASESNQLIQGIDRNIDPKHYESLKKDGYKKLQIKFPQLTAVNRLTALLSDPSRDSPWSLALLTDWSIFPSSDDLYLYYQFRKFHGNSGHISDGPGHLFLPFEVNELRTLISICILNSWDLLVVNNYDHTRFKTSHDECIDIFSNDDGFINGIQNFKEEQRA